MAKTQQKDIFAQARELGSEALHKLADVPGGSKLMEMANDTRSRLDEIQKKLRGLDELEKRVAKLERQLAVQPKTTTARKSTAGKTTSPRRRTTAKKPPA